MTKTPSPAIILVVDDNPRTLTEIDTTLGMAGYQCHCADSVPAALQAARGLHLDLIVTDVVVHGESGLELSREICREAHNAGVPALFLTAGQTTDIIRRSHDLGGAYYLRKPFDPDVLVELVSKALWMPHLIKSNIERLEPASRPKPSGLQHFTNTNRRRTFQMFRQDA